MDWEVLEKDCTHRSESARDGDSGHGAAGLPQSVSEHCVYMGFRKELGEGLFSEERWVNWRRRMERVVEGKGRREVCGGRESFASSQPAVARTSAKPGWLEWPSTSDSALVSENTLPLLVLRHSYCLHITALRGLQVK